MIVADGELMSKALRYGTATSRSVYARLLPVTISAAVAAALAALFAPVPAMAAPYDGQPLAAGVPDSGSRPTQVGSLVLPGTPVTTTTVSSIPGSATSPVLQKIEKGRVEVDQLGDQLVTLKSDRDLAQTQVTTAQQKVTDAQTNLQGAQADALSAASQGLQDAAAVPPGALDSGLLGLDQLARIQRGEKPVDASSIDRLESAQVAAQLALDEQTVATDKFDDLTKKYDTQNVKLTQKQTAQDKYEAAHKAELDAAEAAASANDLALGSQYLAGPSAGRGADPRAVQALQFALAQRGDPYVWSEEGPDEYDCSGLMYAAYHSVGFPLVRVSRDQYWQTRNKAVDRYSLLPGDLLFWSYTNSWTGIHHVAMYAGDGMMIEAPRTGLNVRLVPVRWSTLFGATRVFGSVEGGTDNIPLGTPDSEVEPTTPTTPTTPAKTSTPKPTGTKSTTPKPSATTTKPGGGSSSGSPDPEPSTSSPSDTPSSSTPSKTPDPDPTTTTPAPEETKTTTPAEETSTTSSAASTESATSSKSADTSSAVASSSSSGATDK
ncbi:NlpC/P60 family protein [Actinoplanes sp. HUAS TT8]|uniref:C40 family peptidase n=1 Tax=Actinoplanes sp. HUAS TT8 TaxID=3447453 RepID=UPI003F5231C3